jgi:hypothetical protein
MSLLDPRNADETIVADAARLAKAGIRPPHPDSPAGRRLADASARERSGYDADRIFQAQLARGRAGSSSQLHDDTVQQALRRGDRGWTAVERLSRTPGLTGGAADLGGRRPEYDPRFPGDPAYYDAEAQDQIQRAALASHMQSTGMAKALAALKVRERAQSDPLLVEAVQRAERKARKKGRAPKADDITKAYRKLHRKRGMTPVEKSTLGGLLGNVLDLRVGRRG